MKQYPLVDSRKSFRVLRHLWIGLIFTPFLGISPAVPQTLASPSAVVYGALPLPDSTLSTVKGTGIIFVRGVVPAPGNSNVVLWDELARNTSGTPVSTPGFSVTFNGKPK